MRPFGIVELVRTGRIAMVRGNLHVQADVPSGFDQDVSDDVVRGSFA